MIGRISGRLDWRGPDHVLIDVRGVGYIIYVSERTLAGMPSVGEAVSLYTDLLAVSYTHLTLPTSDLV